MKYWLVCSLLVSVPGEHVPAQPRLAVDNSTFDFGMVERHCSVVHRFWLKSTGTDTLVIQDVKTPCGCTVNLPGVNWVAPGDSTPAVFIWNTRACDGTVRETPYIFTNSRPDPYRLALTANCSADGELAGSWVSVSPSTIIFEKTGAPASAHASFLIRNLSEEDLSVAPMSAPADLFSVALPDSVSAGSTGRGLVRLAGESLPDELVASITLEFRGPEDIRERLTLAVSCRDSRTSSGLTTIDK